MAPTLGHRLYDGTPRHLSGDAPVSDVVRYLVRGNTPKAAISMQGVVLDDGSSLPLQGDPHPDFGYQLRAATFDVQEAAGSGADTFMVVAVNYTVDGQSFSATPPDVTDPDYTKSFFGTKTLNITVPTYIVQWESTWIPINPGPVFTETKVPRYQLDQRTVSVPGSTYTREVSVDTFTIDTGNIIAAQHDKIHTLGGQQWQFVGGDARPVSTERWVISYSWFRDPGNGLLNLTPPPGGVSLILPTTPRAPFQQYFIHWAELQGPPPPGDVFVRQYPVITAQDVLVSEPGGWATLPGIGATP